MSDTIQLGEYVVGEKPIPLLYVFTDSSNTPLDLTGYTSEFHWQERDGTPSSASAVITNAAKGECTYTWTGSEFSSPGRYAAEFWVGNGLQRYASWKIMFTVRGAVGTVPSI